MSDRQTFLDRVRAAVREGNHVGNTPPLPSRGTVGHQGAGAEPARRFAEMLEAAGGFGHLVPGDSAARASVLELAQRLRSRRVLLGSESVLARLQIAQALSSLGCEIVPATELNAEGGRDRFFAADLAVTGVEFLIAETGSMIMLARPTSHAQPASAARPHRDRRPIPNPARPVRSLRTP